VAEGTIGGAAVGFEVGGPLGAAIGGAAGVLAGLGEIAAGVKSPQNKAKDDIKSIYHISISNSMADQIVGIANSKYGGNISVATHSPEVREMLGVYAAGTNQSKNFPMGADMPHGAGLIESGGMLSQAPVYQYGHEYAYQSNLPLYGGGPAGALQTPGGNPSMSFNIAGANVTSFFQGQVFTPDAVSSNYSAAMAGSNGRLQSSSDLTDPGSLVT